MFSRFVESSTIEKASRQTVNSTDHLSSLALQARFSSTGASLRNYEHSREHRCVHTEGGKLCEGKAVGPPTSDAALLFRALFFDTSYCHLAPDLVDVTLLTGAG